MNKRHLHHWFTVLKRVKTWQLLVLLVILTSASAFFLRQNNLQMVTLRNLVIKADEDNVDIDKALINLQHYVAAHMNTNLGDGVALQHSYERAYTAAVDAAADSTNPQAAIYTQVELECRPIYQSTHSFPAYTSCAHDKLAQLTPGQDPLANIKTPSSDLYVFNFASPLWSPDVAGFTVVLTIVVALVLIFKSITYLILRAILRSHR